MLVMVIETFADADMRPTYRRLAAAGRGLPDGLRYLDSWVEAGMRRCFQIMECDDAALLQEWVLHWRDCGVSFEIVPVVPASRTRELVTATLDV
jgi:hypothetical protein